MTAAPMRVAYVVATTLLNFSRRAHAIQVMKNAQAWQKAVADFELVTTARFGQWLKVDRRELSRFYGLQTPCHFTVFPLGALEEVDHPAAKTLAWQAAAWRCRLRQVDLTYTRGPEIARTLTRHGLATIMETHALPDSHPRPWLGELLRNPRLIGLVTITEPLAEPFLQAGLPRSKLLILPDGVDLERFIDLPSSAQAKATLQRPSQRLLVVYAGHLYAGRGVEDILWVATRRPEIDFLLVGGFAPDVVRWQAAIHQNGLTNVELTGFIENHRLPIYLAAADLLLMPYGRACPTHLWMSPLKMFEYMAAGRAIIASDFPVLRSVLHHGDNSWLTPPDQPEGLLAAVEHLAANQELRERLGSQAARDVIPYSWDNRVAQILNFARERR